MNPGGRMSYDQEIAHPTRRVSSHLPANAVIIKPENEAPESEPWNVAMATNNNVRTCPVIILKSSEPCWFLARGWTENLLFLHNGQAKGLRILLWENNGRLNWNRWSQYSMHEPILSDLLRKRECFEGSLIKHGYRIYMEMKALCFIKAFMVLLLILFSYFFATPPYLSLHNHILSKSREKEDKERSSYPLPLNLSSGWR